MKVTESQLKQMAIEEIQLMIENGEIDEGALRQLAGRAAGGIEKLKGKAKGAGYRALGKAGKMAQKGLGAAGMGKLAGHAGEFADTAATGAGEAEAAGEAAAGAAKASAVFHGHLGKMHNISKEMTKDAKALGVLTNPQIVAAIKQVTDSHKALQTVAQKLSAGGAATPAGGETTTPTTTKQPTTDPVKKKKKAVKCHPNDKDCIAAQAKKMAAESLVRKKYNQLLEAKKRHKRGTASEALIRKKYRELREARQQLRVIRESEER